MSEQDTAVSQEVEDMAQLLPAVDPFPWPTDEFNDADDFIRDIENDLQYYEDFDIF